MNKKRIYTISTEKGIVVVDTQGKEVIESFIIKESKQDNPKEETEKNRTHTVKQDN